AGSFENTTRLEYRVPETATVTVSVFNLLGQEVALLAHEEAIPGNYQVNWDGRNQFGAVLPTGIYFCRMTASANNVSFQQIVKMTVIQ
ncbi:T9SS type A sorting domain-containing protein, partial [bacterium]|nr:T9SS type A sorting domain-containing protein [bacterium]